MNRVGENLIQGRSVGSSPRPPRSNALNSSPAGHRLEGCGEQGDVGSCGATVNGEGLRALESGLVSN
jgi:hypothetical protein